MKWVKILVVSELKVRIEKYFNEGNEDTLHGVVEALLQRRLVDKHGDTDDKVMDSLQSNLSKSERWRLWIWFRGSTLYKDFECETKTPSQSRFYAETTSQDH